jgi:uncharacterized cupredoxin-like copper-binding protein
MIRRLFPLLLFVLLSTVACAGIGDAVSPNNAVIRITQKDMSMRLDTADVPTGKVTFLVVNQDKVDHEVIILKTDIAPNALVLMKNIDSVDEDASGENLGEVEVEADSTVAATFDLAEGKYVLVCNVPGHYKAGMVAALNVKGDGTRPQVQATSTGETALKGIRAARESTNTALAKYREGKADEAYELAAAAYLNGFEKSEADLAKKDRALMESLETQFKSLREAIKAKQPVANLEAMVKTINDGLEKAEKLLQ